MHMEENACSWSNNGGGRVVIQEEKASVAFPDTSGSSLGALSNLPPEIRNLIYHLALGRHRYHAYAHTDKSWSRGRSSTQLQSQAKMRLYECINHKHDLKREWLDEHLSCFAHGHTTLPGIQLLRVCKRIHQEAGLIPYAANGFTFIAPPSFETFVSKVLTQVQAKALRSISLWSSIATPSNMLDENSWRNWTFPAQLQDSNLLAGVQRMELNFSIYGIVSVEHIPEVHQLLRVTGMTGPLLRKLDVVVSLNEVDRPVGEVEPDVEMISEHIKGLRRLILMRSK